MEDTVLTEWLHDNCDNVRIALDNLQKAKKNYALKIRFLQEEVPYEMGLVRERIRISTRKLSARWTVEPVKDLEAQYSLDIEQDIIKSLINEGSK